MAQNDQLQASKTSSFVEGELKKLDCLCSIGHDMLLEIETYNEIFGKNNYPVIGGAKEPGMMYFPTK